MDSAQSRPRGGRFGSSRQRLVASVVLLCASLLAALGALEAALRLIYPPPVRFVYPQEFYDFDPEMGNMLRRRQQAFTHDRPVRTNALGLRDHEIAPEPAPGTVRVLALGDSQTFGNGLALDETWPKQLERALAGRASRRWEVINAGVSGTDTWQHEILLRRLIDSIRPHVVVLMLYVNDVVPRHDPRTVDSIEPTNTLGKRLVYLAKRSAVLTWILHRVYLPWRARQAGQPGSVEAFVLAGTDDARAERGWRQVEQSLAAMRDLCAARNSTLLVAILPRRDQVSGAVAGQAYTRRARAILARHAVEAVDLLPDLMAAYQAEGERLFIPWDGHNSAVANRLIAARLATRLADVPLRLDPR